MNILQKVFLTVFIASIPFITIGMYFRDDYEPKNLKEKLIDVGFGLAIGSAGVGLFGFLISLIWS